jgi:hypothetical protein
MTTRIRKVFTAIDANGNAFSEQHAETLVGGKWFPLDPTPLVDGSAWATQYNAAIEAENTRLKDEKANLTSALEIKTSQLEATTQAKTALDLRVATLTNEKQSLTSQVSMLEAVVEAQKQKVIELEQYRPYNPRILAGKAFYSRVSKEDMVTLLTSEIPELVTVGKTIVAYAENDWPVILDSTDFQDLVGYVLQSGVFDETEVVEIMRDATREEAYRVPE